MANSEELISTTDYLTLQTECRINRCHYNRVQLHFVGQFLYARGLQVH
jgi:hypothetical protein